MRALEHKEIPVGRSHNRSKRSQSTDDPRKRWRIGTDRANLQHFVRYGLPVSGHPIVNDLYDFHKANLKKGVFSEFDFSHCDFSSALFYQANIHNSNLSDSDFSKVDFYNTSITQCNLSNSKLKNIRARKSIIQESDLSSSDFTGSDLESSSIKICRLDGADFSFCNLLNITGMGSCTGLPKSFRGARINPEVTESICNKRVQEMIENQAIVEKYYEYDIAISFASEDRRVVEAIADQMKGRNIKVFYDAYEEADLWGKNLYEHLTEVYKDKAIYCLMVISSEYIRKVWTKLERRAAQARAFVENEEYILPLFLEKVEVAGVLETTGYISMEGRTPEDIANLALDKLSILRSNKALQRTSR